MANAPVDVATPKLELVTWVRKWMSKIAEGVGSVWIMSLCHVSLCLFHCTARGAFGLATAFKKIAKIYN
jgi:hypothetical protein